MYAFFSRGLPVRMQRTQTGSSVLAALVLVGGLAVATLAVQALSGPQNSQAQSAQVAVPIVPPVVRVAAPRITSRSPATCKDAIEAAMKEKRSEDPEAESYTNGKSGVLDKCYGAIIKTGKDPAKATAADYNCTGRFGYADVTRRSVSVVTKPDPKNILKAGAKGSCKITICEYLAEDDAHKCGPAKVFEGGITLPTELTPRSSVDEVASSLKNDAGKLPTLTGNPTDAAAISRVFGEATPEEIKAIDDDLKRQTANLQELEKYVGDCTKAGETDGCGPGKDQTLEQLTRERDAAAALEAELKQQSDALKLSQTQDLTSLYKDCSGSDCIAVAYKPEDVAALKKDGYECGSPESDGSIACYKDKASTPDPSKDYWVQQRDGQWCNQKAECRPASTFTPPPKQSTGCTGPNCDKGGGGGGGGGGGQQQTPEKPGGGGGGGFNDIMKAILGGLAKGLAQGLAQQPAQACPSDPNAYAQQQQQYNQQMQQYNYQLQQFNYQQQLSYMNGMPAPTPPIAPQPCTPNSNSNTCSAAPAQPNPAGCTNGTWRPITTQQGNGYQCTSGWQCVPGGGTVPTAQISCSPKVADVGMTVTIAYGCGNATGSTGQGFDTNNQLSGSTTTVITAPPAGATGANFELNCTNQGASKRAQCTVQIGRPTIVLVANPKVVDPGKASTIGWITSGMQSCVVSSPEDGAFTAENATNTSVNGMASTSPLTSPIHILLHCVTIGGGTRDATTTVSVVGQPDIDDQDPNSGTVTVRSTADGESTSRGSTVTVSWNATNPPSGAHIALWLYDVRLNTTTALIADDLAASSTYAWHLPNANSTCDPESIDVCGADLVPGRQYGIEADLYTDTSDPNNPNIVDYGFTPEPFTISS
ncbi:MAG: hypothetical protein AAB480_01315 [Patescibacteria group bacterium]